MRKYEAHVYMYMHMYVRYSLRVFSSVAIHVNSVKNCKRLHIRAVLLKRRSPYAGETRFYFFQSEG